MTDIQHQRVVLDIEFATGAARHPSKWDWTMIVDAETVLLVDSGEVRDGELDPLALPEPCLVEANEILDYGRMIQIDTLDDVYGELVDDACGFIALNNAARFDEDDAEELVTWFTEKHGVRLPGQPVVPETADTPELPRLTITRAVDRPVPADAAYNIAAMPFVSDCTEYDTMPAWARRYMRLGFALQAWVESGNGPMLNAAAQLSQDENAYE